MLTVAVNFSLDSGCILVHSTDKAAVSDDGVRACAAAGTDGVFLSKRMSNPRRRRILHGGRGERP